MDFGLAEKGSREDNVSFITESLQLLAKSVRRSSPDAGEQSALCTDDFKTVSIGELRMEQPRWPTEVRWSRVVRRRGGRIFCGALGPAEKASVNASAENFDFFEIEASHFLAASTGVLIGAPC